jgi:hypothetical protein
MATLLANGNTTFKSSASKHLGWKSSELTTLITAVEAYQRSATALTLQTVFTSLVNWFRSNPKEMLPTNRGSRARELLLEVIQEAGARAFNVDIRNATWQPSADTLIQAVLVQLNECKDFVCSDAAQFDGDINPNISPFHRARILQRAQAQGQATGLAEIPRVGRVRDDWNPDSVRRAHQAVYERRAGECTSFAKAAAHLLSTVATHPFKPRIEVLAFRQHQLRPRFNRDGSPLMIRKPGHDAPVQAVTSITISHVFCVVGRRGVALTPSSHWNPEVRIVDCWLGSLGYDCVFTASSYPKQGYFTSLEVVMDSHQGADAAL